jgi:hypothetical protein
MWKDSYGFKHEGPSPYIERKLKELEDKESFKEKYKKKIVEMCKWLDNMTYFDPNTKTIKLLGFVESKDDFIEYFRKKMEIK